MDAEKYRLPTAPQNYVPHSKAFGNNKTVSYIAILDHNCSLITLIYSYNIRIHNISVTRNHITQNVKRCAVPQKMEFTKMKNKMH